MAVTEHPSHKSRRAVSRRLTALGARLVASTSGSGGLSARLSTWVGVLSAMIGGFLGLTTYQADVAKRVDERVEKSFEMVAAFNAADLAAARLRVLSYVEAKRRCDARVISRDLIDNDFVLVLDFFDLAHACVDAGLCDAATAERFFAPYANYQWPVLEKTVADMRSAEHSLRADPSFGGGMARFAREPAPAPPCDGNF